MARKLKHGYYDKFHPDKAVPIVPTSMVGSREGQFYLQEGAVFNLNGEEVETPPKWVQEAINAMDEPARERLGFGKPKTVTVKKVN